MRPMASIPNPPIFDEATPPTANQTLVWSGTAWTATTVTSAAVSVPQTHIVAASAPSAESATTLATANASVQTGSYVQADVQSIATLANANKVTTNALVTDVGTLVTELAALTTKYNTLLTELQTAGVLSAS